MSKNSFRKGKSQKRSRETLPISILRACAGVYTRVFLCKNELNVINTEGMQQDCSGTQCAP